MLFQRSKAKSNEDPLQEVPRTVEEETVRRWRDMAALRNGEKVVVDQIQDEMAYTAPSTPAPSWPTQLSLDEQMQVNRDEQMQTAPEAIDDTIELQLNDQHEFYEEGYETETVLSQTIPTEVAPAVEVAAPAERQQTVTSDLSLSIEEDLKRRFGTNIKSALGPGTVIEGTFRFDSPVCIDGTLTGEVSSTSALIVGADASVTGTIRVGSLIVLGTVNGKIDADELVEVRNGGMLEADIQTRRIAIEEGGWFNGRCIMKD